MAKLRLVPELPDGVVDPAEEAHHIRSTYMLPGGEITSGTYGQWRGTLYRAWTIDPRYLVLQYDAPNCPLPGWTPSPAVDREGKPMSWSLKISAWEVERYVDVLTTGSWRGFEFGLEVYQEDGLVAVMGGGRDLADLIESGGAPELETYDRGRSVTGMVRWDELTDVKQVVEDLPLPV